MRHVNRDEAGGKPVRTQTPCGEARVSVVARPRRPRCQGAAYLGAPSPLPVTSDKLYLCPDYVRVELRTGRSMYFSSEQVLNTKSGSGGRSLLNDSKLLGGVKQRLKTLIASKKGIKYESIFEVNTEKPTHLALSADSSSIGFAAFLKPEF